MSGAKTDRRGFFEWLTGRPTPRERPTERGSFSIDAFYRQREGETRDPLPRFEIHAAPVPTTRVGVTEFGEASANEPPVPELPEEERRLAGLRLPDDRSRSG